MELYNKKGYSHYCENKYGCEYNNTETEFFRDKEGYCYKKSYSNGYIKNYDNFTDQSTSNRPSTSKRSNTPNHYNKFNKNKNKESYNKFNPIRYNSNTLNGYCPISWNIGCEYTSQELQQFCKKLN
jgi:hypothetical protein